MAETLDTLADKIAELTSHMSTRAQLDDLKSGLRTQIEAVDAKVGLVLEKVDHLIKRDIHHSVVHARGRGSFLFRENRNDLLRPDRK